MASIHKRTKNMHLQLNDEILEQNSNQNNYIDDLPKSENQKIKNNCKIKSLKKNTVNSLK